MSTPSSKGKQRKRNPKKKKSNSSSESNRSEELYPEHTNIQQCERLYDEHRLKRGTLRVINKNTAFVACDRGSISQDILVHDKMHRNRALHGDTVYIEVLDNDETIDSAAEDDDSDDEQGESEYANKDPSPFVAETWQDDEIQMALWNPQVTIERPKKLALSSEKPSQTSSCKSKQPRGKVVHVSHPNSAPILSELRPTGQPVKMHKRMIVGTLKFLNERIALLCPTQSGLDQFKCNEADIVRLKQEKNEKDKWESLLVTATYTYGSWKRNHTQWPPCTNIHFLGNAFVPDDQVKAILFTYGITYPAEFSVDVLRDVEDAVASGLNGSSSSWEPTPDMCQGRRDYRTSRRVFTIDPTTAKDLDDALHIKKHADGTIELGVHIADVSHFVQPGSHVDKEALFRATTVYLVDRTIPMLPRMLCEVACSLNENVDRLAFSCVWRMHPDGTLVKDIPVWYGRTVIRSCARLDYSTAQNIIDSTIPSVGSEAQWSDVDWWIHARRPSSPHTMSDVVADVRLMHSVAMARRRLRFANGALALNAVKLTFQLNEEQEPMLAAPYPIRDANRVVEEFMLLANYFTAERLISHAGDQAVLRRHPDPKPSSLDKAVKLTLEVAQWQLDVTSSTTLQRSIEAMARHHADDPLLIQCVTQQLMMPMEGALYFAAGAEPPSNWHHYALNMPYYTHFTSPIRRYPDILVHRLLQATLDGSVEAEPEHVHIQSLCEHCSERQGNSREAQQRCDRVFLALYTHKHEIPNELGIVVSIGKSAFTVFVPRLGCEAMLFLEEHKDTMSWTTNSESDAKVEGSKIFLHAKDGARWKHFKVELFVRLMVTIVCKEATPIDIKVRFEAPIVMESQ